ncbi:CAAX farnesyltransferase (FTase) subunit beta [Savitreella phatthalungensis]
MPYESRLLEQEVQQTCELKLRERRRLALNESRHIVFLKSGLGSLPTGFTSLDAGRPWLWYWCLNGIDLLPGTSSIIANHGTTLIESLRQCQHPDGGFCGGPGQLPHIACAYAAILAACVCGQEAAFTCIDRRNLYSWLLRLKQPDGSFVIHEGGEADARSCYLALACAALLDLLTPEITRGCKLWLSSCQRRIDGGFGGTRGAEAHAGLSYCTLAALCLLEEPKAALSAVDLKALTRWLVHRQTHLGGLSGRSNKLVDGCYSWWAGAEFAIVGNVLRQTSSDGWEDEHIDLLDRKALERYILLCCQNGAHGGLVDKPGKRPDYYHTCYVLLGLSCLRYAYEHRLEHGHPSVAQAFRWTASAITNGEDDQANSQDYPTCFDVRPSHPLFGVRIDKVNAMRAWFAAQEGIHHH